MTEEMVLVKKQFLMDQLQLQYKMWHILAMNGLEPSLYYNDIGNAYATVLKADEIINIGTRAARAYAEQYGFGD